MKKRYLLLFGLVLIFSFKTENNLAELPALLLKISAANEAHKQEAFHISYKLFQEGNPAIPIAQLNGLLIRDKNKKYCKLGEVESLELPNVFIGIDQEDKILLLADGANPSSRMVYPDQLKEYLKICKSFKEEKIDATHNKLTLVLKDGAQDKIELFYHLKNYKMEKINLYFKVDDKGDGISQNQKLEIVYTPNPNIQATDDRLKLNHYLLYRNGVWIPQGKFQFYEFVNNRLHP